MKTYTLRNGARVEVHPSAVTGDFNFFVYAASGALLGVYSEGAHRSTSIPTWTDARVNCIGRVSK